MKNENLYSPLRNQCETLPDLIAFEIGNWQTQKKALPADYADGISRVILTGCGDSILAAEAATEVLDDCLTAVGVDVCCAKAIHASRYLAMPDELGKKTLVIIISASGGTPRLSEIADRANKHGCRTLAVTNVEKSPLAQRCRHVVKLNTPKIKDDSPGLRSYEASLVTLMLLAEDIGFRISGKKVYDVSDMLRRCAACLRQSFLRLDEVAFLLAQQWKGLEGFEFIADGKSRASAEFVAAKFSETSGILCSVTDAENWYHINLFAKYPESVGVLLLCDTDGRDTSRVLETANLSALVEHPTLLVCGGNIREKLEKTVVIIDDPLYPVECAPVSTAVNFVPGALIAAYISALNGSTYFGGAEAFTPEKLMLGLLESDIVVL